MKKQSVCEEWTAQRGLASGWRISGVGSSRPAQHSGPLFCTSGPEAAFRSRCKGACFPGDVFACSQQSGAGRSHVPRLHTGQGARFGAVCSATLGCSQLSAAVSPAAGNAVCTSLSEALLPRRVAGLSACLDAGIRGLLGAEAAERKPCRLPSRGRACCGLGRAFGSVLPSSPVIGYRQPAWLLCVVAPVAVVRRECSRAPAVWVSAFPALTRAR